MHTQYEIAVGGSSNAAEGPVHGLLLRSVLLNDRIIACNSNLAGAIYSTSGCKSPSRPTTARLFTIPSLSCQRPC